MSKARRREDVRVPIQQRMRTSFTSSLERRLPHPGCALVFLTAMALVVLVGLYMLIVSLTLFTGGVSTTGTITSYREATPFCRGGDFYHVLFVTSDKRQIDLEKVATSCSHTYQVGEKVPVLYTPSHANEAEIANVSELWGWPVVITLVGALAFLVFLPTSVTFLKQSFQQNQRKEQPGDQSL